MRELIAKDLKETVQQGEFDLEDVRFAMDFDLGVIDADEVEVDDIDTDEFLDQMISQLDDEKLLEVRDFFLNTFSGMY